LRQARREPVWLRKAACGRYQIAIDQIAVSAACFEPSHTATATARAAAAAAARGGGKGALVAIATWPSSLPKNHFRKMTDNARSKQRPTTVGQQLIIGEKRRPYVISASIRHYMNARLIILININNRTL